MINLIKCKNSKQKDELQRLVKKAKPLPNVFDPNLRVNEELVGWVILNAETWRPKRSPAAAKGRGLKERVNVNGLPYDGLIIMDDGRVYLADLFQYAIMAEADGTKTMNDIVAKLVAEFAEDDEEIREWLVKNDEEKLKGLYSGLYIAAAILKEHGLLI